MRIRDTRMHCVFGNNATPTILRESCWREATFESLSAVSLCSEPVAHAIYVKIIMPTHLSTQII